MSRWSGATTGLGDIPSGWPALGESPLPTGFHPALEHGEMYLGWGSPSGLGRHEPRQNYRRSLRCEMMLLANLADDTAEPIKIPGQCLNISDGGLYGIVPVGYGVTVGQRYTFELTTSECGPEPGLMQVVSQQGRILRAEVVMGPNGTLDRMGIGVRLHGRRNGVISMPTAALDMVW